MQAHGVVEEVDIELPLESSESDLHADLLGERQRVANHAYGFISRGNRDGGFLHVRQWIEAEVSRDDAYLWFFNEMLKWESRLPALFFAQEVLRQLLNWGMDREALKLVSRCLHEDENWRPRQEDRNDVQALLDRHGREDLLRRMRD